MSVKPILFNGEMVKAILEGRKTVTRRIVKFIPGKNPNWTGYVCDSNVLYNGTNEPCNKPCIYKAGDILYVCETYNWYWNKDHEVRYIYRADYTDKAGYWKPSIYMPKEAARIWLEVTDVRMEQLQDITWQQAAMEGCQGGTADEPDPLFHLPTLRGEFQKLWNSTVEKSYLFRYGWDANPWVWVIEFEQCEKPEEV